MDSIRFGKYCVIAAALAVGLISPGSPALAQNTSSSSQPAYLNPALPIEQRVDDLISRMTLEEKASQLVNQARAIQRLQVSAYDWWSEALHGVAVNGTTEFPEPIGLAATFDSPRIKEMAVAISTEGRIKHAQDLRAGHSDIFEGLDFWAPNINIFRDPRWGRGQETYGEDPFLTGRMGVAFVTGMQGNDPRYYRAISTPKHYAVHSGPEPTRHTADVTVSKHDEMDTYLPAFRATITEAKAGSIMCAYNSVNGQPACANEFLLVDQLRNKWNFKGYVVSDCGAVQNIFNGHHYKPTQPEASAVSLKMGMDNECVDFFAKITDDRDYAPYVEAVKQGLLKESDIDAALKRLFAARMKLGMFDPPSMVPYDKIDEKLLDGPEHRALARKLANESMVLLKNDGVLPLKSGLKIALVGPLADQTLVLLGNYNGIPTHTVSVLEGMQKVIPGAQIHYVRGTQFLSKEASPVPPQLLTIDGKQGARADYYVLKDALAFFSSGQPGQPLTSRNEPGIAIEASQLPSEVSKSKEFMVTWETTLTPQETDDYNFGFRGDGFFRVWLDGKVVTMAYHTNGVETKLGHVHLEANKPYAVKIDYGPAEGTKEAGELIWSKLNLKPEPEAATAAKDADVVVAVVGLTSELEGEEMPVSEEGFQGGDRLTLDLPKPEQDLLESVAATGKPLVVVLLNGSALSVNWAKEHANAILEAWYPGEEGGAAIAETLTGANNPGGRLPVTFYKSVSDLPPFEDYSMSNRTYRYFGGTPLYAFGYGLSYAKFEYHNVKLSSKNLKAGEKVTVSADVKNMSARDGDEVVEVYLTYPKLAGAPKRALCGFTRVGVPAGGTQHVELTVNPRSLSYVNEAGDRLIAAGSYKLSIGGAQPGMDAKAVETNFEIKGQMPLPE